jgi:hypothetical protein
MLNKLILFRLFVSEKLKFCKHSGQPWTNSNNMEADAKAKSEKDLDSYALERWEAILHYLAEKPQKVDSVSRDTTTTLTHAGLMYDNLSLINNNI